MEGHPIFAAAYDAMTAPMERGLLGDARRRVLASAHGRVLEVGAGTGANLRHYPAAVVHVDLCEPDPHMRRRLERRVAEDGPWPFTTAVHDAPADGPFPGPPYDAIVTTLVLCTVPDAVGALRRMADALADDGRLLYLEHVRAAGAGGRVQRLVAPGWSPFAGGCRLDRDTTAAIRGAGFTPVEQRWLKLPPPLLLAAEGAAVRRVRPS